MANSMMTAWLPHCHWWQAMTWTMMPMFWDATTSHDELQHWTCTFWKYSWYIYYSVVLPIINRLMQKRFSSIANVLKLHLFCIHPLMIEDRDMHYPLANKTSRYKPTEWCIWVKAIPLNLLAPGRLESHFRKLLCKLLIVTDRWSIS